MNKINIVNDKIDVVNLNSNISFQVLENLNGVKKINVEILKDTSLIVDYNISDYTILEISFNINENVNFKLYEIKNGLDLKIRTSYVVNENSILNVIKFNDIDFIKENINILLQGKNSIINYSSKTIATNKERYDLAIYHNCSNTTSNIKNNGVAIENGNIKFNVSSFVPNGIKSCDVNQINRIINLTKNKCEIKPNLYIDEFDVTANHSALIGKFSDEEMFYLESRGIEKDEAISLLIKGFLLSDIDNDEMKKDSDLKISKYWR